MESTLRCFGPPQCRAAIPASHRVGLHGNLLLVDSHAYRRANLLYWNRTTLLSVLESQYANEKISITQDSPRGGFSHESQLPSLLRSRKHKKPQLTDVLLLKTTFPSISGGAYDAHLQPPNNETTYLLTSIARRYSAFVYIALPSALCKFYWLQQYFPEGSHSLYIARNFKIRDATSGGGACVIWVTLIPSHCERLLLREYYLGYSRLILPIKLTRRALSEKTLTSFPFFSSFL